MTRTNGPVLEPPEVSYPYPVHSCGIKTTNMDHFPTLAVRVFFLSLSIPSPITGPILICCCVYDGLGFPYPVPAKLRALNKVLSLLASSRRPFDEEEKYSSPGQVDWRLLGTIDVVGKAGAAELPTSFGPECRSPQKLC